MISYSRLVGSKCPRLCNLELYEKIIQILDIFKKKKKK